MPQPLAKAPSDVAKLLAQALQFHHQGRLPDAERLYAEILIARPDHFDALQMMALIKLAKGEPADALELISAAMRSRKPSPQVLLNYGIILNELKRYQEAVDSFDAALKQKSKYAEAHNNRRAALSSLGRDEEATESFRKALQINPNYGEAHYNNGSSLRKLGRYDEALKSFDRALALRPCWPRSTCASPWSSPKPAPASRRRHNCRPAILAQVTEPSHKSGQTSAATRMLSWAGRAYISLPHREGSSATKNKKTGSLWACWRERRPIVQATKSRL
jgi:tetratricopeptide (TPR) repeat protein